MRAILSYEEVMPSVMIISRHPNGQYPAPQLHAAYAAAVGPAVVTNLRYSFGEIRPRFSHQSPRLDTRKDSHAGAFGLMSALFTGNGRASHWFSTSSSLRNFDMRAAARRKCGPVANE